MVFPCQRLIKINLNENIMKKYHFYKAVRNPEFHLKTVIPVIDSRPTKNNIANKKSRNASFESCHKRNNSENLTKFSGINLARKRNSLLELCTSRMELIDRTKGTETKPHLFVKTVPINLTLMLVQTIDESTGEIIHEPFPHFSNEIKAANNRKKKTLNKFCNFYEPLYCSRKVSIIFFTFTRLNHSNMLFSDLLDNVKYHFSEQLNRPVRGYFWALEVSHNFHLHYHLCVAIDRLAIKKMPKALMFENLWGQRTEVSFVKKSIRRYLSKYLAKDSFRVLGMRSYGKSSKYL